uniref:(northern house mosquito) hypothetical protein n=1 Tax=Culex pipiens TaxID=7175 RepID=A0A8D8CHZ4_CULPI
MNSCSNEVLLMSLCAFVEFSAYSLEWFRLCTNLSKEVSLSCWVSSGVSNDDETYSRSSNLPCPPNGTRFSRTMASCSQLRCRNNWKSSKATAHRQQIEQEVSAPLSI